MEREIIEAEYIEDVNLTGDVVAGLKDKSFEIIQKPQYEMSPDLDRPDQMKKKLIMQVRLTETGANLKYYPNKTSRDTLIARAGLKLADWVGFRGEFYTMQMKVGKDIKNVVFIK